MAIWVDPLLSIFQKCFTCMKKCNASTRATAPFNGMHASVEALGLLCQHPRSHNSSMNTCIHVLHAWHPHQSCIRRLKAGQQHKPLSVHHHRCGEHVHPDPHWETSQKPINPSSINAGSFEGRVAAGPTWIAPARLHMSGYWQASVCVLFRHEGCPSAKLGSADAHVLARAGGAGGRPLRRARGREHGGCAGGGACFGRCRGRELLEARRAARAGAHRARPPWHGTRHGRLRGAALLGRAAAAHVAPAPFSGFRVSEVLGYRGSCTAACWTPAEALRRDLASMCTASVNNLS